MPAVCRGVCARGGVCVLQGEIERVRGKGEEIKKREEQSGEGRSETQ